MKNTTVYELRNNLAEYLHEVFEKKAPLIVYKFKRPIAVIIPPDNSFIADNYKHYYGFLNDSNENGLEFEKRVRRRKIESSYVARLRKGL